MIQQEENEIKVDENNIDLFKGNLNIESIGDQPTKDGEIVNLGINEIEEKFMFTKSAKVTRTWIECDLPPDNQLLNRITENALGWKTYLPSFYSRPLTPLQIFDFFFNEELLSHIVKQTILYAIQKVSNLELGVDELRAFIGIR